MRRTGEEAREGHRASEQLGVHALLVLALALLQTTVPARVLGQADTPIFRQLLTDVDAMPQVEFDLPTGGVELTEFLDRVESEIGLRIEIGGSVRRDIEKFGERRIYITNPIRVERERLRPVLSAVLYANDCILLQSGKEGEFRLRIELTRPRYYCHCSRFRWVESENLEDAANEPSPHPVTTSVRISRPWLDDFESRLRKLVDRGRLACYTPIPEIETLMLQGHAREVARLVRQIPDSALIREKPYAAQDSRPPEGRSTARPR